MSKEKSNRINVFMNLLWDLKFNITTAFREKEIIISKRHVNEKQLSFIAKSENREYQNAHPAPSLQKVLGRFTRMEYRLIKH